MQCTNVMQSNSTHSQSRIGQILQHRIEQNNFKMVRLTNIWVSHVMCVVNVSDEYLNKTHFIFATENLPRYILLVLMIPKNIGGRCHRWCLVIHLFKWSNKTVKINEFSNHALTAGLSIQLYTLNRSTMVSVFPQPILSA